MKIVLSLLISGALILTLIVTLILTAGHGSTSYLKTSVITDSRYTSISGTSSPLFNGGSSNSLPGSVNLFIARSEMNRLTSSANITGGYILSNNAMLPLGSVRSTRDALADQLITEFLVRATAAPSSEEVISTPDSDGCAT